MATTVAVIQKPTLREKEETGKAERSVDISVQHHHWSFNWEETRFNEGRISKKWIEYKQFWMDWNEKVKLKCHFPDE